MGSETSEVRPADGQAFAIGCDHALRRPRDRFEIDENEFVPDKAPIIVNQADAITRVDIEFGCSSDVVHDGLSRDTIDRCLQPRKRKALSGFLSRTDVWFADEPV